MQQENAIQTDGKFYSLQEMVRASCQDCRGCYDCCKNMGNTILLDPYDIYQFQKAGIGTAAELLQNGKMELSIYKGLIIPNLKMQEDTKCCGFLNENGRCSIHESRPGICRLFPLGRNYEEDVLTYILLKDACTKNEHAKVKVEKWIGVQPAQTYHEYLEKWHAFRMSIADLLSGEEESVRNSFWQYILQTFYLSEYDRERDFYSQFYEKVARIEKAVYSS